MPSNDEREQLLWFLEDQRRQVMATAEGLSEDQLRWTPDGRLLPILGIINHLTHVERRWTDGRYLCTPFPPRGEEFAVPSDLRGADLIAAYQARAARTEEVVRGAGSLDDLCLGCEGDRPPAHVILGLPEPIDLRWAVLHLIEETAHHAGHAESTREMLDGRTMSD